MRNLLGRLNARSNEELERIAAFWKVPVTASDRPALVAQLFRELHDPRTARDCWDRLSGDEQAIVRLLAVAEDSPELSLTIPELAALLGADESTVHETARHLYQKGILAREGLNQPLPVGEMPRVFMPRELTLLFRRVQDELEAGDLTGVSFSSLLELLDDSDIQRAAEIWGYKVVPGLRTRSDLVERLLELTANPDLRRQVEKRLGWDARRVYGVVRESAQGAPVSLTSVAAATNLSQDDARTAHRLRQALEELEEALLVWHTYRDDGSRWLFATHADTSLPSAHRGGLAMPEPLLVEPVTPPEWFHPAALAWDLLTVLRVASVGDGTDTATGVEFPRRRQRALNDRLWRKGPDLPPAGYLEFLIALADNEGIVDPGAPFTPSPSFANAWKLWKRRSFSEQMGHLLYWWLAAPTWIEAAGQRDVLVHGAEWPQFRRKALVLLQELESMRWYRLEDVAAWLAFRQGDILGDRFEVATARPLDSSLDPASQRKQAVAQVVEQTLRTGFVWFGLIELSHIQDIGEVLRTTPAAAIAAESGRLPEERGDERAPLQLSATMEITLERPTPLHVWSLSAFSDQIELRPLAKYALTEASLKRALSAGFRLEDVTQFLERQSREPLPADVAQALASWAESFARVWFAPALVLQPEQADSIDEVRRLLDEAGFHIESRDSELLIDRPDLLDSQRLASEVGALLKQSGRNPQTRQQDHEPLLSDESAEREP